jgi:Protein of unknown function (DUF1353)
MLWLVLCAAPAPAQAQYGTFPYPLDLRMSRNGREATLLTLFVYVDANGKRWEVPSGTQVNGASIPWPLWSLIGSPWTGKYREASVVHDYFCETKTVPWKLVHRNFYTSMLANGVGGIQAKVMYIAVYRFGPRWNFEYTPECPNCAAVPHRVEEFTPEFDSAEFKALEAKAKSDASLEALEAEADALFRKDIHNREIGTPVFIR